jgi:uncharacterized protein (TIGR03086 family)
MEAGEYFTRTLDFHSALAHDVGDRWSNSTPDDEWDVRALENHVTSELVWIPPLFDGLTIAEVGDRFEGDLLGDDEMAAWDAAVAAAKAAIEPADALSRTVHLSFGDFSGGDYLDQVASDLLIHGWDLARGLGVDDTMPADLVERCAAWFVQWEDAYRGAGVIAEPPPVPDGADAQTRLLAAFGRRQ